MVGESPSARLLLGLHACVAKVAMFKPHGTRADAQDWRDRAAANPSLCGCLATACAARPPRMSLAAAALAAALRDDDLRIKQMPDTPAWRLPGSAVCFARGFFTIVYQDLLPRTC